MQPTNKKDRRSCILFSSLVGFFIAYFLLLRRTKNCQKVWSKDVKREREREREREGESNLKY